MRIADLPEISKLSTPEKIILLEDFWDSILKDESEIPISDSHKQELDSRHKKYQKSPGKLLTLEELKLRIEAGK